MKALEIKNLHKSFTSNFLIKQYHILKGINITVEEGEIYGFLGPNGAGKTTTMKCVLGLITPDSGEISIFGQPTRNAESRRKVGFLPEQPYFYDYLTAEELLMFTGMLFSLPKTEIQEKTRKLIKLVGLADRKDIKLKKYSKGLIQRVGLAQALIHEPDFLILDEPFSGLDPIGRKELRDIILSLKDSGKTIFFSSHILQDMEMMVDRVGIILNGRIKKQGRLSDLISHSVRYYEIVFTGIDEQTLTGHQVKYVQRDKDYIIKLETNDDANKTVEWITRNKGNILAVTPIKMTLEDIFLEEINQ
ncbi:MAG: ATP-binding cassette domain-containing protein [Candidatus Aminicenantes bacterium]|nr:ATP-binding cassette domain-containing protein [Candidatus Aminicenantes bacterium]NIN88371.1 ATP-binding cassette domain-containing protein [Candidatus Aminicenantes bacterium]NIO84764.1 ATP-binding cassette domain-containing protein [Candidatus Aminicenantes bacterium]NIQ70705.1 ATP-binding cassette domain-containing protein [Candidatus Aminicenantes bacterium]NIT26751.1 ATP-binding cassette domain-containing protein [Candidatus Aminicenantes bacterium]